MAPLLYFQHHTTTAYDHRMKPLKTITSFHEGQDQINSVSIYLTCRVCRVWWVMMKKKQNNLKITLKKKHTLTICLCENWTCVTGQRFSIKINECYCKLLNYRKTKMSKTPWSYHSENNHKI